MNEIIDARATKVRGAVTFILNRYLIDTSHMAKWKRDLRHWGRWPEGEERPR